jgi:hypothetical protein
LQKKDGNMTNRVRYYISENGDEAVVRSVPVSVTTQPQHHLMSIDRPAANEMPTQPVSRKPVGRIVKVLRKPTTEDRS